MTTTSNPAELAYSDRDMDFATTLRQIGGMNVAGISGGRYRREWTDTTPVRQAALELPVSSGYSVRVVLAANDTYTVQRVMRRGGKVWVKGTMTDVYFDDLGETCYVASCYKNRSFPIVGGE